MTVFEKVAASPETLGALLASLTVIDSPWESAFHEAFCADCNQCDCGTCPHENVRNNPTWWLTQESGTHKTEKLFAEIQKNIVEIGCPLEEAIKVLEVVKIACINAMKSN